MARDKTVKTRESGGWKPTRRELLAAVAAGVWSGAGTGFGQTSRPAPSPVEAVRPVTTPWWSKLDDSRSRVVNVRSPGVLQASAVNGIVLGEMVREGIQKLTQTTTPMDAWRAVLGSSERIVLKFNSVGADVINTNDVLANVLVEQLSAAGYSPEHIALVEVPEFVRGQLGTRQAERGWGEEIPVGGRLEPLARYLYEAEAIINIPLLKTHQIAGMTGCLKNLSHALIRHPARYHANGCSPFVGQVVGARAVSSKIRLNLVNAVRAVVDRGPAARAEDIVGYGGLLLGFDPVAVDNVGLSVLLAERRRLGLPPGIRVPHLASAITMGLGRWRPAEIDLVNVETPG